MLLFVLCPRPGFAQSDETPPGDGENTLSGYTMGVFLLENGQPQKAIPHLLSAWEASRDEQIGNKLCEAYFRVGDLRSCLGLIDELVELNSENDVALLYKARIKYFKGDGEQALVLLNKLREIAEPSFEVERLAARIQLELGQYDDALSSYEKAARLDSTYPVVHYRIGILQRRAGRVEEAETSLKTALQLQPVFAEAVIELAELLVEAGRIDEARDVLLAFLERDGESYEALMMAVDLVAEREMYGEAIELLEARQRSGDLPRDGVLTLGRLYYESGDYASALDIFESMFQGETRTSEQARILGELSLRGGQPDKALEFYKVAIELAPDDYRNHIALFFASSDDFGDDDVTLIDLSDDEKLRILADAAALVPAGDFDGFYVLGACYQTMDQHEKSREYFAAAVEIRPDSERALLNLAGALEQLGRYEEAEPILVGLYEENPEDARICNFYGYLLALMNTRLDQAERLVRTALQQEPDNGYYVDSLGWVYYMRGDFERAVIELERASLLVRDDPTILEHLGDAYRSLERFRDALAAYERSRDLQGPNSGILDKIDSARDRIGN
jgi:tetratricopeptide (TPR) repeat protein